MIDNSTQIHENIIPKEIVPPSANRKLPGQSARISIHSSLTEDTNNNSSNRKSNPVSPINSSQKRRISSPKQSKILTEDVFTQRLSKLTDDASKQSAENSEEASLKPPPKNHLDLLPPTATSPQISRAVHTTNVVILDSSEDEENSLPPASKRSKCLALDEDEVDFTLNNKNVETCTSTNGDTNGPHDDEFESIISTFCEVDD